MYNILPKTSQIRTHARTQSQTPNKINGGYIELTATLQPGNKNQIW